MKKTILRISMMLIMMIVTTTVTFAQQITKQQLKELIKLGSVDFSDMQKSTQQELVKFLGNSSTATAQQVSDYMEGPFYDDIVECAYPYYAKHITEKDYEYLVAQYNSAEGKLATQHNAEVSKKFVAGLQTYFAQDLASKMPSIMQGQKVEPRTTTCSPAYKAKWESYSKSTGVDKMIDAVLGQIKGMFANQNIPADKKAEFDKVIANLMDFLVKDMFAYMCNMSEGTFTESDLDFFTNVMNSEAGTHVKESGIEMISNIAQFSQQFDALRKSHFEK